MLSVKTPRSNERKAAMILEFDQTKTRDEQAQKYNYTMQTMPETPYKWTTTSQEMTTTMQWNILRKWGGRIDIVVDSRILEHLIPSNEIF